MEQGQLRARTWKKWVTLIALIVFLIELLGGFWADSHTVLAYCIMWTLDIVSFGVSELVLHLSKRNATGQAMPLGSHLKADVVGNLVSLAIVWVLTLWVFVLTTKVWFSSDKVQGGKMLIVGLFSLLYVFKEHAGKQIFKK